MGDDAKQLSIAVIIDLIGQGKLAEATAGLEKLKSRAGDGAGTFKKLGENTEESAEHLQLFNVHSHEMNHLLNEANQIAPNLGFVLRGLFRPELLGIGLAVFGIRALIDHFKEAKQEAQAFIEATAGAYAGLKDAIAEANTEIEKNAGKKAIDDATEAQKRFETQTTASIAAIHRQEEALVALTNAKEAHDLALVDLAEKGGLSPAAADARREDIRSGAEQQKNQIKDEANQKELEAMGAAYDALAARIGNLEKQLSGAGSANERITGEKIAQANIDQLNKDLGDKQGDRDKKRSDLLDKFTEESDRLQERIDRAAPGFKDNIRKNESGDRDSALLALQTFDSQSRLLEKEQKRLATLQEQDRLDTALNKLKDQEVTDRRAINEKGIANRQDSATRASVADQSDATRRLTDFTKSNPDPVSAALFAAAESLQGSARAMAEKVLSAILVQKQVNDLIAGNFVGFQKDQEDLARILANLKSKVSLPNGGQ